VLLVSYRFDIGRVCQIDRQSQIILARLDIADKSFRH
jgi:hypothetical protein